MTTTLNTLAVSYAGGANLTSCRGFVYTSLGFRLYPQWPWGGVATTEDWRC